MKHETRSEVPVLPDRPQRQPIPMAPGGTPNTLTLYGIGLGTVCGKPGKWQFQGLSGAYVMCRQETHMGGLISGLRWVHFGRSTWPGWVVELPEDGLDEPVAHTVEDNYRVRGRKDLMLLLPNERYTLFHSLDRDHFMRVKEQIQKGEVALESVPGALKFEFTRLQPRKLDEYDLLPWLLENGHLDEHSRAVLATHLLNPARGWVRSPENQARVANIDVTPEPLRALFVAEFLQWYALMATKRSGEHLAALHRARSLIAACETGARDAIMEMRRNEGPPKRGTPEFAVLDEYREYAWKCAMAGVKPDLFLRTLPRFLSQAAAGIESQVDLGWERTARQVQTSTAASAAGAARHPGLDPAVQNAPSERGRMNRRVKVLLGSDRAFATVKGYFNLYTLGLTIKREPVAGRGALRAPLIDDFMREYEQTRNGYLTDTCRKLLDSTSYPLLQLSLLQHGGDSDHRLDLFERYLEACAWAEHPWWTALAEPPIGPEASLWHHLSPHVKWLAEAFKSHGKTLSGLVEARLNAYSLALGEAHALMEALFRHEISLSGTTVDPSVHYLERVDGEPGARPNFRARVNLQNGKMIVTRDEPLPDAPHTKVTLKLLRRVGLETPDFPSGPAQNSHAYQLATNIRASYSVELLVPVSLAELKQRHTLLPRGFAACAELLNVTRAAATLVDNVSRDAQLKEQVEPAWDLVKGVVTLADSHQAILKAMARPLPLKSFTHPSGLQGLRLASTVLSGADGAFKIYKGAKILFSDRGDLEYELRQGRAVRATLQATKGLLQIAGGVAGILAAVPATGALAATPIGLLIVCGAGLVSATLDVALDATQEFDDHVSAFEQALSRAEREELDVRRFRVSTTLRRACQDAARNWQP